MIKYIKNKIKKFEQSGIYNNKTYNLRLVWVVCSTTPRVLNFLSLFTFTFLVTDEFYVEGMISRNHWLKTSSVNLIAVNLCYNCLAGCIFYFLTIHVPREVKKMKMFGYLNSATAYLFLEIVTVFKTLIEYTEPVTEDNYFHIVEAKYKSITKDILEEILKKKNPHEELNSFSETCRFENWIDYWQWKATNVNKLIRDLLPYYDLLSPEFLYYLGKIDGKFRRMNGLINRLEYNNDMYIFLDALDPLLFYSKKINDISSSELWSPYFRLNSFAFNQDRKEQDQIENEIKNKKSRNYFH